MIWLEHTPMEDWMDSHRLGQFQLKEDFPHFADDLEWSYVYTNPSYMQLPLRLKLGEQDF